MPTVSDFRRSKSSSTAAGTCSASAAQSVSSGTTPTKPASGRPTSSKNTSSSSDRKQTAAHRDRDRMRTVVGAQFVHEILDVEIDRVLGDRELVGDLLVLVAVSYQAKHVELPARQLRLTEVLGEPRRHLGRHV